MPERERFMKMPDQMASHPRLTMWAVLSVAMVVILYFAGREVGLLATQWLALLVATILLAGLCTVIISLED